MQCAGSAENELCSIGLRTALLTTKLLASAFCPALRFFHTGRVGVNALLRSGFKNSLFISFRQLARAGLSPHAKDHESLEGINF